MDETVRVQRLQHVSVPQPRGSADAARHFYGGILSMEASWDSMRSRSPRRSRTSTWSGIAWGTMS